MTKHLPTCTPYCAKTHCVIKGCTRDAMHGSKTCSVHNADGTTRR